LDHFIVPFFMVFALVVGSSGRITKNVVRVHVLGGGSEKAVGLELVAKSFAGYQMIAVFLSEGEAQNLINLLQSAVHGARENAT
jgi:hypothetical protein